MRSAVKIPLLVNEQEAAVLDSQSKIANWLYNKLKVAALDPNHKNFAYAVGTDGKATEVQNPYFLKPLDKRIDQLKAKRDRCQKK